MFLIVKGILTLHHVLFGGKIFIRVVFETKALMCYIRINLQLLQGTWLLIDQFLIAGWSAPILI